MLADLRRSLAAFKEDCGDRGIREYILIVAVAGILGVVCHLISSGESIEAGMSDVGFLERNPAGLGERDYTFEIEAEGVEESIPIHIVAQEQKLTEKERKFVLKEAAQELESLILGGNESAEHITENLFLPSTLQDGLVDVAVRFDNYEVMGSRGEILWEHFREGQYLIKVLGELTCQGETVYHEFFINLNSEGLRVAKRVELAISNRIQEENQKEGESRLPLPQEVEGHRISWHTESENIPVKIFLVGILAAAVLYIYRRNESETQKKKRLEELNLDYPNIVNQLSLLTATGMTVATAWGKIAGAYKGQKENGVCKEKSGYEEMLRTLYEIQDGVGEPKAYAHFGERCGIPSYRKLSSLLVQNIRKGSKGIQKLLDGEAEEAFIQRKLRAKQLGEEAGTKLLVPMGLMLILVFVILLVPAGISLS